VFGIEVEIIFFKNLFFYLKLFFIYFLNYFNIKNNFKKYKKYIFNIFLNKKYLKKQLRVILFFTLSTFQQPLPPFYD